MINICGPYLSGIGCGIHTIEIYRELKKRVNVAPVPMYGYLSEDLQATIGPETAQADFVRGTTIMVSNDPSIEHMRGKHRIAWSVWDTSRVPEKIVNSINKIDELWVPSKWGVDTFSSSGVTVPIRAMPEGVSLAFNPDAPKLWQLDDNKFKFLYVGGWGLRKNPETLVKAFSEEFDNNPDVELIMHCSPQGLGSNQDMAMYYLKELGIPSTTKILFSLQLSQSEMPMLYTSCDAFVTATHSESWGLPIEEAMACGLPTVFVNYSGMNEYSTTEDKICYKLNKFSMVPAEEPPHILRTEGSEWASVDIDELKDTMRYIYEHRVAARKVGLKASQYIHDNYLWSHSADKVIKRLEELR